MHFCSDFFEDDPDEIVDMAEHKDIPVHDKKNGSTPSQTIENESFAYVGGVVVKKFGKKYPFLGKTQRDSKPLESWTNIKNRGGLHYPSDSFLLQLTEMRETFQLMHRHELIEGNNSVKQTVEQIILSRPSMKNMSREVVWCFVKLSTHFRIKYFNKKLKYDKKRAQICRNEEKKKKLK